MSAQTLDLRGCENLYTLPASISQLTQLDEASRRQLEAMLRGALSSRPFAAARDYTAFEPSTHSAVHQLSSARLQP